MPKQSFLATHFHDWHQLHLKLFHKKNDIQFEKCIDSKCVDVTLYNDQDLRRHLRKVHPKIAPLKKQQTNLHRPQLEPSNIESADNADSDTPNSGDEIDYSDQFEDSIYQSDQDDCEEGFEVDDEDVLAEYALADEIEEKSTELDTCLKNLKNDFFFEVNI